MEAIVKIFRAQLEMIIKQEQQKRGLDTQAMLRLMQGSSALPEFYRVPAQQFAAQILEQWRQSFPQDALAAALQEATKAVYGAWIREHFRMV